jgi:cytoskeletal protein CcmA (bactofilin family)
MWGNKKPDVPQAAQPEPQKPVSKPIVNTTVNTTVNPVVNPIINQPPKPAPASWEEKPAMTTDAMRPLSATGDRASARLGSSLHVKGEISGSEDLLIDGSVEGLIQLDERKLTVGATAKVTADIIAREVVVFGTVKGNLRAKDRIEIKKDGSVNGDLTTSRIMIEDGAYFKGSIEIDRSADKTGGTSAFAKSAAAPVAAPAAKTI